MDVFDSLKDVILPDEEVEYINFPWNKGKRYTSGPHTKERKEAISMALKGNTPWNKGKKTGPISDETKQKMSESHKGKEPWNKGIKTPEEIAERKKAYRKAYYAKNKK